MTSPVVKDFGQAQTVSSSIRNAKRSIDDFESDGLASHYPTPATKRTALLPIRTSPKRPKRPGLGPRKTAYISSPNQIPTPVESSEDELYDCEDTEMDTALGTDPNEAQLSAHSARSESSMLAQIGEEDQMELGVSPMAQRSDPSLSQPPPVSQNKPPPLRLGPSRWPPDQPMSDRIPTPMYPTFQRNSHDRLPTLRTTALSPALGGDTPDTTTAAATAAQARPPSPPSPEHYDMDTSMSPLLRQSDRTFTGLNIDSLDEPVQPGIIVSPAVVARSVSALSPSGRGSPRLHMGWRADCEKCRQRVPGHYNHVLWG